MDQVCLELRGFWDVELPVLKPGWFSVLPLPDCAQPPVPQFPI